MQDSADATGFVGSGAMSLTLWAQGTRATVSDTGGIEYTQRSIMFWSAFLWGERCAVWTAQRAVRLGNKVLSPKAPHTSCTRPLRGRDQTVPLMTDRRRAETQLEQEQIR